MAVALKPHFYPVKSPRGRLIHAMAEAGSTQTSTTVCDRPMKGWVMALEELDCPACLLAIGWDCRRPARRRPGTRRVRR
jgi:hypothetical protein